MIGLSFCFHPSYCESKLDFDELGQNNSIFIKLYRETGCLCSKGRDIIMQWFVRLIRLDMEYFMLENKERHRCSKIYITKIIDSDKITEQCKRERK